MLANAVLLRKLLPVVDDFERAMATLPASLGQLTWCKGVLLIQHKLGAVLESEGVKPIETEGQAFDPRYHEAVTYEEVSDHEEGQIIGEVQRGYLLGDRVLRPALVRVAKAPVLQTQEDVEEDGGTEDGGTEDSGTEDSGIEGSGTIEDAEHKE
ncbi:MAG: nucleotide exchange factor GrpE [Anaerolineae bacterium]|nr:nucleotide exchange factor GrpE [Anaerolineae bacterium]